MSPDDLEARLRTPIDTLDEAFELAYSSLELLESEHIEQEDAQSRVYTQYRFFTLEFSTQNPLQSESTKKISRPINDDLFTQNKSEFKSDYEKLKNNLRKFDPEDVTPQQREIIHKTTYTLVISIGVGMDFLLDQQGARKNFGERFDDIIVSLFDELNVANKSEVKPFDQNQIDIIVSPYDTVRSNETNMDPDEVVVSIKTTSKDRFKNMYSDKSSLESTVGENIKWTAIFLYDVQRQTRETTDYAVQKTFVPGRFEDLQSSNPLDGIYYVDPPREYQATKFGDVIGEFDRLICEDLWKLL